MHRLFACVGILLLPCLAVAADHSTPAYSLLSLVQARTAGAHPAESVIARVQSDDGAVYEVQVTAPEGRSVDPRVANWATGRELQRAANEAEEPLELGGYRIQVDKVAGGSASCNSTFSLKSKPVNLGPDKGWVFQSSTAIDMSVTAFPTKGDVDVAIFTGPELTECQSSFKKKQNLDFAGCVLTNCANNSSASTLHGIVGNITTSSATYVGSYSLVFVTLP